MAKGPCPVNEGPHSPTVVGLDEIEVGPELVTYERIECSACGAGISNNIVNRRKKD